MGLTVHRVAAGATAPKRTPVTITLDLAEAARRGVVLSFTALGNKRVDPGSSQLLLLPAEISTPTLMSAVFG